MPDKLSPPQMYEALASHLLDHSDAVHDGAVNIEVAKGSPHLDDLLRLHHYHFVERLQFAIREVLGAKGGRPTSDDLYSQNLQKCEGDAEEARRLTEAQQAEVPNPHKDTEVTITWAPNAIRTVNLQNVLASDIGMPVMFDCTVLAMDEYQTVPDKYKVRYTEAGQSEYGKSALSEDMIYADAIDDRAHIVRERFYTDLRYAILEEDSLVYSRKEKRRVNAKLYSPRIVTLFQRADKARVIGILGIVKPKRKREDGEFDVYIRCVDAERRTPAEAEPLSKDEEFMFKRDAQDTKEFLNKLTVSFAPHLYGVNLVRIAALLWSVGGYEMGKGGRDQFMVYIVGDPGLAKSQVGRAAEQLSPHDSHYANFQQASARGSTFGQEEIEGHKVLRAGVCVVHKYVIFNEFDKGTRTQRDDISDIMSDQLATYNKVPFSVSQQVDCSILALGNPKHRKWRDVGATLLDNLRPLETQIIDRFWIIRVLPEDPAKRRAHIKAHAQGNVVPPYTPEQLTNYLAARRKVNPPDAGGYEEIERFFTTFDKLRESDYDIKFDSRQEGDVMRIGRGLARLLNRPTFDVETAKIAIDLYRQSLQTLGINTEDDAEMRKNEYS